MADVLDAYLTPGRGYWLHTSTGRHFYPQDPRPEEVAAEDIANGLALTCRYGGQGRIDRFYSVAEHCVHMAHYAERQGYPAAVSLCMLLHDAAEAYTGDLIMSMKKALPEFKRIEEPLERVILEKYGMVDTFDKYAKLVKHVDCNICRMELEELFGDDAVVGDRVHLKGVSLGFWRPELAKTTYLDKLSCYTRALGMTIEGEPRNG